MNNDGQSGDRVIDVRQLHKQYKLVAALQGLDVAVPRGSVTAFLGRNGAGKTTTFRILLGFCRADRGEAQVLGFRCERDAESVQIRARLGFVSEPKRLYPYMTVEQVIRFTRPFFPGWRADLEARYLKAFALPPGQDIPTLSKGMLTKLNLLLAMCRGAELLILDEPTEGLDPEMTEMVLQELMALVADGKTTVFFSSHQLAEVEQIADRVCLIHQGRTVLQDSLDDLKAHCRRLVAVFANEAQPVAGELAGFGALTVDGRTASLLVRRNSVEAAEAARRLGAVNVEVHPVSLKELFLETGRVPHALV